MEKPGLNIPPETGVSYHDIKLLAEISQQITATLSVEEIVEKTYKNVNSLMDASVFDIGIFNPKQNRIDTPGCIEKGEQLPFSFYNLEDTLRPAVWCFLKQEAFFTNDFEQDYADYFPGEQIPESIAGDDPHSVIYLPLSIQGKRIGVITVQSFKRNAYTHYHLDMLKSLALSVATALENARLYETMEEEVRQRTLEVSKQKEELEAANKNILLLGEIGQQITATLSVEEIIQKTYKNVNELMDASAFIIGIYEPEKNELRFPGVMEKGKMFPVYSCPLEEQHKASVWCFLNQKELVLNDYQNEYPLYFPNAPLPKQSFGDQPESIIYVPLSIQNKRIGVISVQSFKKNAYTAYHAGIVRNLATYVSIALENARHYENMETEVKLRTQEVVGQKEELEKKSKALVQSYDNVTLLGKIGQQITSTLDLEKILEIVYANVNNLMDASSFSIGYYNREKQVIEMKLGMEKGLELPRADYEMWDKNRLAVWCVDHRKPVFINDYDAEHTQFIAQDVPVNTGEDTESLMFLPLIVEERVVGVITVQSFRKNAYTPYHLEILQTLASYVAVALNNAEAYKELNLAMQEVEKLSIVASKSENTIVICNTAHEMIWANEAFTITFGHTLEAFIKEHGPSIYDISSNPSIQTAVEECITQKTGVVYESRNQTINKGERWFQTTISPVFNETGELRYIVFIDADITELKRVGVELHQKNKEVIDSIYYARRIQTALFTSHFYIRKYLQEYFILFQPKDIVSGDFYWVRHQNECVYVVTADCTGHGVPGAFMSMMGINLLNDIVIARNISNPALILDIMREEIVQNLNPEGAKEEARDGMDIVLCKFDLKNNKLDFAAANNSLYILRNGKLTEHKGDKMPVGKGEGTIDTFTKHTIGLQEGDIIYTFTDGYPDQFGGEKGKKFKYRQLEEFLLSNSSKPMSVQKEGLKKLFENWKGQLDQVDDVLVVGIRI